MSRSRDPQRSAGTKGASAAGTDGRGDAPRRKAPAPGAAVTRTRSRAGAAGAVARPDPHEVRHAPRHPPRSGSARKTAATRTAPSKTASTPRAKAQPARAKQPVAKRPAARKATTQRPRAKASPGSAPARTAPVRKAPVRKAPAHAQAAGPQGTDPARVFTAVAPHKRLIALFVIMALALSVILVRLVDVQGVEGDHYEAMALAQRVHSVTLAAERGSIFDRNGNDLALSVPQHTIYADPRVVKDPAAYARKLAPIVHVNRADLRDLLAKPKTAFVYVARKVDDATAAKVKKLALPGVGSVPESKRFYPGGTLAGPVLGFVGTDNDGLGGLEAGYESTLKGKPGRLVAEEDPDGREIPATQRVDDPAKRGGDLVLSLDQSLQYEVEKQLIAQVSSAKARGGIAIIEDVKTGDVLAMASVDGSDAHGPARLAPANESNRPLTAVYEPGSTAKVVTVGAALETGVVKPDTMFQVPWRLQIADRLFSDAEQHNVENWTVSDIVRESSNIGVIKIAAELGKERLDQYQRAFGFGTKTAINFPGESAGLMKNVANFGPSDMGSVPIGYTTAVTPMQMLDVFATVANGGSTRPPRLVDATIGADGTRHEHAGEAGPARRQREHRGGAQHHAPGRGDRRDRHRARRSRATRSPARPAPRASPGPARTRRPSTWRASPGSPRPSRPGSPRSSSSTSPARATTSTSVVRSPHRSSPGSCSTPCGSSTSPRRRP